MIDSKSCSVHFSSDEIRYCDPNVSFNTQHCLVSNDELAYQHVHIVVTLIRPIWSSVLQLLEKIFRNCIIRNI